MKNRCTGSGEKPRYLDKYGCGVCPGCPSSRQLRADGRMRVHQPSPDYNAMVRDLLRVVKIK